jgi:putative oxidoreductase
MEAIFRLHRRIARYTSRYDGQLSDWGGSLMSLALRLFVSWQFFKSGMVKISDWSATLELFRSEYHVPLLSPGWAAVMGAGGELLFPVLLAFGLLSRPAALGLFVVNLMAVISYPQLFMFDCPAAINDHFYWGLLLLVVAAFGPGRFSLDAWLARHSTA